jgi:DNA-binding XRE family transcriptional regulator
MITVIIVHCFFSGFLPSQNTELLNKRGFNGLCNSCKKRHRFRQLRRQSSGKANLNFCASWHGIHQYQYFFYTRNFIDFLCVLPYCFFCKGNNVMKVNISDQISLGREIRKRRKHVRLRIDDAAALCGISVSTLSALENGSRPASITTVLRVLSSLGMKLTIEGGE